MSITDEIKDFIESLQKKAKETINVATESIIDTSKEQLASFINFTKNSEVPFIKDQGKKALEYTEALATGKISYDNYQNLMIDIRDLLLIEEQKIEVKYKVEMEKFHDNIEKIFINGLMTLIKIVI